MRRIPLLITATVLACSTTAASPPPRSAQSEQQYQRLLAGKVAQAPVSCMPTFGHRDMFVIDQNTIAFQAGSNKVYVAHMRGGCAGLNGPGPYALVTRQVGSSGYCQGDIADVVDTLNHFTVASCVFGEFTPYVRVH